MARRDGIRRGSRRNFAGLLITLALHGGIFLAVARAHSQAEAPLIVEHDFVRAEMVKLGKPRDKFWLPRITQPPPPAPPGRIKLADDPNAKPAPPEAPKPEDPKISKDLKRALERARKLEALAAPEEPDEGALDGSKLGTSNQALGDQYLADDHRAAAAELQPARPGMAPDQIATPPEIKFTIGADGALSNIKLTKSPATPSSTTPASTPPS